MAYFGCQVRLLVLAAQNLSCPGIYPWSFRPAGADRIIIGFLVVILEIVNIVGAEFNVKGIEHRFHSYSVMKCSAASSSSTITRHQAMLWYRSADKLSEVGGWIPLNIHPPFSRKRQIHWQRQHFENLPWKGGVRRRVCSLSAFLYLLVISSRL